MTDKLAADGESRSEATVAGSSLLAKNTALNLAGYLAPLLVAAVAVPVLIDGIGTGGFGLLTIGWMFIGSFSMLDLGFSRALTHLISERLGAGREDELGRLAWTALLSTFAIGVFGSIALLLSTPWLAGTVLSMPADLRGEAYDSLYALAASAPFVVSAANLRGVLEARQRFDVINAIRVPSGIYSFLGPLAVLLFTTSVAAMMWVLAAGRVVVWLAYILAVKRSTTDLDGKPVFDMTLVRPLLRFGGWMTVSNVISPVLVYVDRLLIAALLTVSAVAHYATSWEIVTKYLLIPTALSTVLFPAFGYLGRGRSQRSNLYFGAGIKFTFLALFPLVLATLVFARPGLALWIDPAFAAEAYRPMQVLAIGVLLNGMAAVPFAHIQGSGHPDVTAKLHLLELPVYLVLLWWALTTFGIVGAAAAWLVRVAVDFSVLYAVSHRMGRFSSEDLSDSRRFRAAVGFGVAVLVLIMLVENIALQAAVCAIVLVLGSILAWRYLMRDIEKQFLSLGMSRILP